MGISNSLSAWLCVFFVIPSILCSIFVLYHLLFDRTLRRALNNHVIILILFLGLLYELTNIPWDIYFYWNGVSWSSTPAFCLIWTFVHYGGAVIILMLVGWASIERHILIFHDRWMLTRRRRFLIHYLPLIIVVVYCLVYFSVMMFILPCDVSVDYTKLRCDYGYCLGRSEPLALSQAVTHRIVPIFTIVFFSLALLVRVLRQKRRLRQQIHWRKYQKMSIQLLSISLIYVCLHLPPVLLNFVYLCGLSRSVGSDYFNSALYFVNYTVLLVPFVTAFSLPELRAKFKVQIPWLQRPIRAIAPQALMMNVRPAAITPIGQ